MGVKVKYIHSDNRNWSGRNYPWFCRFGVFLMSWLGLTFFAKSWRTWSQSGGHSRCRIGRFLRNPNEADQTIGRAARNSGHVMYADTMTQSMQKAIDETARRRRIRWSIMKVLCHKPSRKSVTWSLLPRRWPKEEDKEIGYLISAKRKELVKKLQGQMQEAVKVWLWTSLYKSRYDAGSQGLGLGRRYRLILVIQWTPNPEVTVSCPNHCRNDWLKSPRA